MADLTRYQDRLHALWMAPTPAGELGETITFIAWLFDDLLGVVQEQSREIAQLRRRLDGGGDA